MQVTPGVSTGLNASPPTPYFDNVTAETLRCQRYYFQRQADSNADLICVCQAFSTTGFFGTLFDLPVTMRAVPTTTVSSLSHISCYTARGGTAGAVTAAGGWSNSTNSVNQNGGFTIGSANLVTGHATVVYFNTTSGWVAASAEL